MQRKLDISPNRSSVIWGDCKHWLKYIPTNSVKLIYIDPPFFTSKDYEILWGNGHEKRCFEDRHKGNKEHYISWMRERLLEAKRVLKIDGSIFLHCDYRANYRLRMLLNEIFDEKNFVNEIIWKQTNSPKSQSKNLGNQIQTIFHFSKNKNYLKINPIYRQRDEEEIKKDFPQKDNKGNFRTIALVAGGCQKYEGRKTFNFKGIDAMWLHKKEVLEKLFKQGKLHKGKYYRKKEYAFESKGKAISNLWTDKDVAPLQGSENIGYPTQKPIALIKRILEYSTKENDMVLDFSGGGGGSTALIAKVMGRKFITGDVSPVACRVMIERLKKAGCKSFETKQIPKTKEEWHLTNGHKFAEMICEFMGWEVNPKKSGDGGIDGWARNGRIPIQVKHHKSPTGRDDIQKFIGALNSHDEGIFVAWHFSPHAWDYIHIAERDFKKKITLLPAHQILSELVLTMEDRIKYQKLYEKAVKASKHGKFPIEMVS